MKRILLIFISCLSTLAAAEMREWTHRNGDGFSAEYERLLFDDVIVRREDGKELRIPKAELSTADREYVELRNPPALSIDFRKSERQEFVRQSPFVDAGKYPPTVLWYQFGARIRQTDSKAYSLPLKVVIYVLAQQQYDPDKKHLVTRIESPLFHLDKLEDGTFEFMDASEIRLIKYQLEAADIGWSEARGEKLSESLILVVDQAGNTVAYDSSKNWLYQNLDKLKMLPVGAWLNRTCTRVHPTPPRDTKNGVPSQ